ncbi:hypothetical protein [Bartonella elizabethae]|uniref:hypothetical protein n=1 Tax=Bartonella elizabethae TaxID=807 RepID=UPI00030CB594|nr:hypothetical protein [Bartonella elizabethae]
MEVQGRENFYALFMCCGGLGAWLGLWHGMKWGEKLGGENLVNGAISWQREGTRVVVR